MTSSRLMAVDDEADITLTLKIILEQRGFSLDVFNDPEIALIKFKPHFYDLLLLDVNMPHMNGFELYQEINKKDRYAKACFFSASEVYYETLRKEFPKLSSGCFIRKPFAIDCLVNKITKALIEFK